VKDIQPEKEQIMNTKLNVLVIDDDAVVGRSFNRVLSGEEGLNTTNNKGLKVTESIEARCPWTPVVVTTGYGTEENESRVSVLGANGFVRNPPTSAKTIAMLIAAPLIALGYVIALPAIGFYHIAKLAIEAYAKNHPTKAGTLRTAGHFLKNVGLFLVSPFIALGYVIALPFVGFYMFTRLALEAHAKRRATA
jgi:hypothetical protein